MEKNMEKNMEKKVSFYSECIEKEYKPIMRYGICFWCSNRTLVIKCVLCGENVCVDHYSIVSFKEYVNRAMCTECQKDIK